jgi:hypothetical protein
MPETCLVPYDSPGSDPQARLTYSVTHFLFCLTCVKHCMEAWMEPGREVGFSISFRVTCVQDSGEDNNCQACATARVPCEQIPAGIEGHRYQLLFLFVWVNHFWGAHDQTLAMFRGLMEPWGVPSGSLAQLAKHVERLCRSFYRLAKNHISYHGLQPNREVRPSPPFYYPSNLANPLALLVLPPRHLP